jgi:hypothetical protein
VSTAQAADADLPMLMSAATFYDELQRGSVCELQRSSQRVRVRIQGAALLGLAMVVIGDSHGRVFRLPLSETVVMIAR